jgi:GNAT superfamily N-acetyltransferase
VQVKCFACDTLVDEPTLDAAIAAFLAHGGEVHAWSYPEQALRNYARNYAEAVERITGDSERLSGISSITAHPVDGALVDDWLHFFDRDAFAGNPDWGACYCVEPHLPATPENPESPWRERRACMAERLRGGSAFGYLAYVDGRTAGWVNASSRADYGLFRDVDPEGPAAGEVIGVSCFVVAPPFRRHGVASTLLDRVIADAVERGASWIEAYPHNAAESSDAAHFRGTRAMYERRGFRPVAVRERDTVMRRSAR